MFRKKTVAVAPLLLALAGCGGGSDGGGSSSPDSPPPQDSSTVLKVFDDGSGVARARVTKDGQGATATVMGPDIRNFSPDEYAEVDPSNVTYDSSNQYGDYYTGTATVNGNVVDVIVYEDAGGEVGIVYAEGAGGNALIALGTNVSNVPSGTYTYNGTNVIGLRDGSYMEQGTFTMGVDFNSRRASISGSTDTTTISGNNLSVDTSAGTFRGDNLSLNLDGTPESATIYGNFHGDGATGVSGLYHDNAGNPTVAGAIAGTR